MWRHGVVVSVMVVLALLVGCFPAKDAGGRGHGRGGSRGSKAAPGEHFKGDTEFTLWNHTKAPIDNILLSGDYVDPNDKPYSGATDQDWLISRSEKRGPSIPPGGKGKFMLAKGKYTIGAYGYMSDRATSSVEAIKLYELDLQGPTELVVYDDPAPPADATPTPGVKQIMLLSHAEDLARKSKAHHASVQAAADAQLAICKKNIPPPKETPAPGKVKPDGKWTCVISGEATGTNYVTVIQLADGHITGTMGAGSADRNTSWEGAMVRDEVHFRYTGLEGGGRLKLDPGGRAMSGPGWTYLAEGHCLSWNLVCTK